MSEYLVLRLLPIGPDDGGRASPFVARPSYRPHLRLGPGAEYLGVVFLDGPEVVAPGVECDVLVALAYIEAGVDYGALVAGVAIEVVEGARVVARGRVVNRRTEPNDWRRCASARQQSGAGT